MIDAHVIPAGFFRRLRTDEHVPRLLTNSVTDPHPKRSPVGVYDRAIVCGDCERTFGPWDDYAQQLLSTETPFSRITHGERVIGYEIEEWDYERLKLFFVSLLWRASVSSHAFYSRVSLGPWESTAREMIRDADPGSAETFCVTLAKFDETWGDSILDPHRAKWSGVNYVQFYLGGFVAYIKVDRRAPPEPFSKFVVAPNARLRIIGRDMVASPEMRVLKDIVRRPKNLAVAPRTRPVD